MRVLAVPAFIAVSFAVVASATSLAQTPATAPKPATTGNVSAGLALTSGNKDTSTFNAGFEVVHDPKTRNVFKTSGLLLRGSSDGAVTAEQYGVSARDEHTIATRTFVYGDMRYLHDKFKGISYLLSPTAGLGHRVVDTAGTTVALSAGVGGIWEKDAGIGLHTSGAVTADEKLTHKISTTATATQNVSALWKTGDLSDALYTFGGSLAATIVARAQLKVEVLDTYKNKPPGPTLKKNDVALLMGVVYKF
jgi:putative salt-induced outer membrane protein